ncbi:MAG: cysteine desulfurase [Candidatus Eremiobacteraeota bacterium]|nr:cysteine desulfurase [Candidatus Eremiobacteraeota bacterium]
MERIYLDHAATTPARPEVVQAMLPHFGGHNPSSLHAEGREARAALDRAREDIARGLNAKSKEIVFTGSGSEADNLAIFGVARARKDHGRHIVSSTFEHHAVLHALDALAERGWEISLIPVSELGAIDLSAFAEAIREDTVLASVMYANNELGTLQPIAALAELAHAKGALFHTDAIQVPAHLRIDVAALGVDLLSLSAHKFYGPKGVGALFARDGVPLAPQVLGGSQEFSRRAGTQNVAGAVGMAAAFELAQAQLGETTPRIRDLRNRFEDTLLAEIPQIRINGRGLPRLPNISNISFAGVDGDALLLRLDLEGIAVSSGSACASGAVEPSHVIAALGIDAAWQRGVVRFSLGIGTRPEQIDHVLAVLRAVIPELREVEQTFSAQ